ncbi:hypothetical protein BDP55DRAFT_767363 [Colletotrichum godetiae]|uniref:BTB domain-containing protein n=1 Tax=Colletotrichum godetiae TaxID=1209918 RepID=A0AAJ0ASU9_9PEZI|nr:uncharacterized protein BDP55DRAFT_767363 [Colletotrichum godetiae]KAK1687484.1 hypothetical protein BDP55DRAFT_767363 [Colletotrichum godetiae]
MYRLLKTGLFSDCQVKCDGKTWNLHMSILCGRSAYFMGFLVGDWPKAKAGIVEITCFTAQQMDWIISWIYTGKFDFRSVEQNNTLLHTSVELWTLGDYFLVQNLCSRAEQVFVNLTRRAQTARYHPDPQDWLNAGRLIYLYYVDMDSTHSLKERFVELTLEKAWARKQNLQMPEFKTLCQEHPEFGNDCMMKLVDDRISRLQ